MSEGQRRPPPGKSFPFLRKGAGQKTKIEYPVMKRSTSIPRSQTRRNYEQSLNGAGETEFRDQEDGNLQQLRTKVIKDLDWQTPSLPRTVRTADSGFHQEGENLVNDGESPSTSSSTSHSDSRTPSSVAQTNIDLRKGKVLPVQQWARRKNYSFSGPAVASPSPMLASTPQPGSEMDSPRSPEPVPALETPILGDVTNVHDSPESDERDGNGANQFLLSQENQIPRPVDRQVRNHASRHPRNDQVRTTRFTITMTVLTCFLETTNF
ncbi:hypothetical protein COOONC_20477 [Cooperia oncophora]